MVGRRQDKMAFFEQEDFDLEQFADVHMINLTEKGIGTLKGELAALQERCETEAQAAIHGSYSLFVDACDGVSEVDSQFQHLRVLVTGTASLANELKRAIQPTNARTAPDTAEAALHASRELSNTANVRAFALLEELDVAIAERDFPVAKKILLESDKELEDVGTTGDLLSLECAVDTRRQTVVQLLESQLQDPTLKANDRHSLLQILSSVAGDVHALTFLLSLHSAQISHDLQQLPKPHRTGESENEGADYSGSLSQCSFHGIGLAVEDFRAIFSSASAAPLSSILTQWADSEARKCAELIKSNAHATFAGLSAMVNSVAMSFVYAQALKTSHSISVVPSVRKVFWPYVEALVEKVLMTTGEEVVTMAHEEMSVLLTNSSPWDRQTSPSNQALLDSAQFVVDRVRYILSVLRPLWSTHMSASLRNGLHSILSLFAETLANDVQEKAEEGVSMQVIDRISEWLMTIIAHLVEELVPKELLPFESKIGVIFTKREIQTIVNRAAQNFGLESV